MKPPGLVAILAAAVGLAVMVFVHAQDVGPESPNRRVALLVGINRYHKRGFIDLKWAENDADELGRELVRIGFDKVVTMKGSSQGDLAPTREHVEAQLKALLADVRKDDVVLVMLAGHGQELKARMRGANGLEVEREDGFFCPLEAVLNDPKTMISLSHLTDDILADSGGKNLLLVDACRAGVDDQNRGTRARGVQGRRVSLPEGTSILFSCASGQTSIERDALGHGVFTYSLLQPLKRMEGTGLVTWDWLADQVKNGVAELNPAQEPILAGSMGRIVLSKPLPTDPASIAYRRGVSLAELKEYDGAIAALDEAIRINPKFAVALRDRGNAYLEKQSYAKAFEDFKAAMALTPADPLLLVYRAWAYAETREYELAILDCNEAIRINPTLARAYNCRGAAYDDKGDPERAMADLNEAIRLDSKYASAYYNRGVARRNKGDTAGALADFDEAIRLESNDPWVYDDRGDLYFARGDSDRAIADYTEAIRLDATEPHFYVDRGNARDKKKDYDGAIADYSAAIRIDANYPWAYFDTPR